MEIWISANIKYMYNHDNCINLKKENEIFTAYLNWLDLENDNYFPCVLLFRTMLKQKSS